MTRTPANTHLFFEELRKALNLPEDMMIRSFSLDLVPFEVPKVSMEFFVSEERTKALSKVVQNYELIEKKAKP